MSCLQNFIGRINNTRVVAHATMALLSPYPLGIDNSTMNSIPLGLSRTTKKDTFDVWHRNGVAITGLLANLLCFIVLFHHTQLPMNKTPHLISLAVSDAIFLWSLPIMYRSRDIEHEPPGPRFNIKMLSYQYRKPHCGDKTVVRSSYLHNGISYTDKMASLYWIRVLAFGCVM